MVWWIWDDEGRINKLTKDLPFSPSAKLGRIGYIALYLAFLAVLARTLVIESIQPKLPLYLAGEIIFLVLFSIVFIKPVMPGWLLHIIYISQSSLILWLLSLRPEFDFLIVLYLLLSAQASVVISGRQRWLWIAIFVLLSGGSLIFFLGLARGLALSLTTIAGEIVIPSFIITARDNEIARHNSQALLDELQVTNQRLQSYASQVEELAAVEERNRLARQLHDTVSQLIFSSSLTAHAAQLLQDTDPDRVPDQIERLQAMTGEALAQLRSLITKLRPTDNISAVSPKD